MFFYACVEPLRVALGLPDETDDLLPAEDGAAVVLGGQMYDAIKITVKILPQFFAYLAPRRRRISLSILQGRVELRAEDVLRLRGVAPDLDFDSKSLRKKGYKY